VLAHPIYNASYAVSVRQYRSLPFGFLHSQGHPWRACHLLTVRSVTSARDGTFTLWIKCNTTLGLLRIVCIFKLFSTTSGCVHCCSCSAHTRNIRKPGDVDDFKFCTFTQNCNGLTGWSFEIPASAYCHPCAPGMGINYRVKVLNRQR
jgi:hypothetical protein